MWWYKHLFRTEESNFLERKDRLSDQVTVAVENKDDLHCTPWPLPDIIYLLNQLSGTYSANEGSTHFERQSENVIINQESLSGNGNESRLIGSMW